MQVIDFQSAKADRECAESEHRFSLDVFQTASGEWWARMPEGCATERISDAIDGLSAVLWLMLGAAARDDGASPPVFLIWGREDGTSRIRWNDEKVTDPEHLEWITRVCATAAQSLAEELTDTNTEGEHGSGRG